MEAVIIAAFMGFYFACLPRSRGYSYKVCAEKYDWTQKYKLRIPVRRRKPTMRLYSTKQPKMI